MQDAIKHCRRFAMGKRKLLTNLAISDDAVLGVLMGSAP